MECLIFGVIVKKKLLYGGRGLKIIPKMIVRWWGLARYEGLMGCVT